MIAWLFVTAIGLIERSGGSIGPGSGLSGRWNERTGPDGGYLKVLG